MGVARIFQRGREGGGITLCQSGGTHKIVRKFSLPVVICAPKQGLQKEGHMHSRTPPLTTPVSGQEYFAAC